MKTILLIGAGKSATVLIDYLIENAGVQNWAVIIADANREQILAKTKHSPLAEAVALDINNNAERAALIKRADIVISMMPPSLHYLVAIDCLEYSKHLLTASYVDEKIKELDAAVKEKGLLFLCEMGLDPGIDHMSAMQIIDDIKAKGGTITSFKSHCGGLVAPESDNNPWHYKISWNPRNVVLAGKAGAEYKLNDQLAHKNYTQLFAACDEVFIEELNTKLAIYPNRDSLSYIPVYKLDGVSTFERTTLRYPSFCKGWNAVVQSGLTDDTTPVATEELNFKQWAEPLLPFVNEDNENMLTYLGFFSNDTVPPKAKTSADILQHLLETKLAMLPDDKDMIVMLHEIEFIINEKQYKIESSLVVKGEDNLRTAMAKTVGLPLGIAAALILNDTIKLKGVHIPIQEEIYTPVLKELERHSIIFKEYVK